jgi:hypothetical protein
MNISLKKSLCILALVVLTCGLGISAPNQFIIVSDLHPLPQTEYQVQKLTDEVLKIRPAFVVCLGDVGNEEFPGVSVWQMKVIDAMFRKWREAGIEIHIAVGNHDIPRDKEHVEAIKRCWFASQLEPYPMNSMLDAEKNPETYRRYVLDKQYYYSFNWRGLHFVIMNSYDPNFSDRQAKWLEQDLCLHANNPNKYPTLVFLHHPEIMSGDRGCTERPLYSILAKHPAEHTVKAVFGGHYHYYVHWPPSANLGAHVYATPASVIEEGCAQFIVATVNRRAVIFEKRFIKEPKSKDCRKIMYYPILGSFPAE